MKSLENYYANLLIMQYRFKPKARAMIQELVKSFVPDNEYTKNLLASDISEAFDIDKSFGIQLDILGKYLGSQREQKGFVGEKEPFRFDTYTGISDIMSGLAQYEDESKGQNPLINYDDIKTSFYSLSDKSYRRILKLISLIKNKDLSLKNIDDALYQVYGNNMKVEEESLNVPIVPFEVNNVYEVLPALPDFNNQIAVVSPTANQYTGTINMQYNIIPVNEITNGLVYNTLTSELRGFTDIESNIFYMLDNSEPRHYIYILKNDTLTLSRRANFVLFAQGMFFEFCYLTAGVLMTITQGNKYYQEIFVDFLPSIFEVSNTLFINNQIIFINNNAIGNYGESKITDDVIVSGISPISSDSFYRITPTNSINKGESVEGYTSWFNTGYIAQNAEGTYAFAMGERIMKETGATYVYSVDKIKKTTDGINWEFLSGTVTYTKYFPEEEFDGTLDFVNLNNVYVTDYVAIFLSDSQWYNDFSTEEWVTYTVPMFIYNVLGTNTYSRSQLSFTSLDQIKNVSFKKVCYGNGLYVLYYEEDGSNDRNRITISVDIQYWSLLDIQYPDCATAKINDITYGNGSFIAVLDNGKTIKSTDGINWTVIATSSNAFTSVGYGSEPKYSNITNISTNRNLPKWNIGAEYPFTVKKDYALLSTEEKHTVFSAQYKTDTGYLYLILSTDGTNLYLSYVSSDSSGVQFLMQPTKLNYGEQKPLPTSTTQQTFRLKRTGEYTVTLNGYSTTLPYNFNASLTKEPFSLILGHDASEIKGTDGTNYFKDLFLMTIYLNQTFGTEKYRQDIIGAWTENGVISEDTCIKDMSNNKLYRCVYDEQSSTRYKLVEISSLPVRIKPQIVYYANPNSDIDMTAFKNFGITLLPKPMGKLELREEMEEQNDK